MQNKTVKKLTVSVMAIIILSVCLCITTSALVYSMVVVEENLFYTGNVKINLNDGRPVIQQSEFLFEPGMTVKKDFFIENQSSCDVYYKLYFENASGGLADVLQITICDNDKVLFYGTANQLDKNTVSAADDVLKIKEKRNLQIYFYFPKEIGNSAQDLKLSFDLAADAVQTKNNTDKSFN